jgi:hypothetical protein
MPPPPFPPPSQAGAHGGHPPRRQQLPLLRRSLPLHCTLYALQHLHVLTHPTERSACAHGDSRAGAILHTSSEMHDMHDAVNYTLRTPVGVAGSAHTPPCPFQNPPTLIRAFAWLSRDGFPCAGSSRPGTSLCTRSAGRCVEACLALPCLALPCPALPCLALPCLALPCLALPHLTLPCLCVSCTSTRFTPGGARPCRWKCR